MIQGIDSADTAPNRLTAGALERHFRAMLPGAAVLTLDDLSGGVTVGCVDGRRRDCVAGAPGGNAGLLVVLLATWEDRSGLHLSVEAVDDLFKRYLDHFGSFYLHTDRAAQDRLAGALGVPAGAVDDLVRRPSERFRPALLDALAEPAHMGCGHLRLMLEEPEEYGVRRDLVRAVLRGFFTRRWDGDERLVLDVLDGAHLEGGVARIRTAGGSAAPAQPRRRTAADRPTLVTACPHHGELELFVYHPDAVEWLQALHAVFLARQGMVPAALISDCIRAQQRLGQRQLDATFRRLAPGLPVFDVRIEADPADSAPASVAVRLEGHLPPHTMLTTIRA